MKQNLKKHVAFKTLVFSSLFIVSACASLGDDTHQIDVQEQYVPAQGQVAPAHSVCSAENPSACLVSYEDPNANLQNMYAPYETLAVATNAAYQAPLQNSFAVSVPVTSQGLSVKEKMHQRELAQQQQDLSLQPVSNADVVCNGDDCKDKLFKTEVEKTVETVVEETVGAYKEPTLNDKLAYGEEVHDWEALSGDNMSDLLKKWAEASAWTVVWKLDRDYKLEAGVVFRGTFTEVAAAFIRSFARATPAPIGTFYKGNRVLVINAQENENAD